MTTQKLLPPNVDWPSARLYHYMGLDVDLYTPIFAMARVAGWAAHVIEQLDHNRLMRPAGALRRPPASPGQADQVSIMTSRKVPTPSRHGDAAECPSRSSYCSSSSAAFFFDAAFFAAAFAFGRSSSAAGSSFFISSASAASFFVSAASPSALALPGSVRLAAWRREPLHGVGDQRPRCGPGSASSCHSRGYASSRPIVIGRMPLEPSFLDDRADALGQSWPPTTSRGVGRFR